MYTIFLHNWIIIHHRSEELDKNVEVWAPLKFDFLESVDYLITRFLKLGNEPNNSNDWVGDLQEVIINNRLWLKM